MQNSGNNKNTKRKGTMRYNRFGWAARGLAVMMAVIFSLTSLGAALPVSAESGNVSDAAGADSSTSSVTPTLEATDTPTPTPTEEPQKPYSDSTEVKESGGTLKVTAKADAGILPEGATLKVKPITKGDQDTSATYQQVEEKVKKDVAEDNRELTGFLAYDISFEKDGQEIEPDGKVNVTMNWTAAAKPEGTTETEQKDSDVSVLHLEKQNDSDSISDTKVVNLTENKEKGQDADNQATVEVKDGSKAVEKAEMTVSGFSVFTITWTTNGGNPTANIGNVSMHYVNDSGLEIDRTATLDDNSLSKKDGEVVKIADWVNDANDGIRKVSGYKYVKATIGSFNGTEITAVKVQSTTTDSKTTYKLYYTNSSTPEAEGTEWILYKDSTSKNDSNNADIYLVFHSTAQSVNVHFVDEDGNILINPIYHYANETDTNGFNVNNTNVTTNPWAEPIQKYEFTGRVHMGETGWQGFAFSKVRSQQSGDDYRYQYTLGGDSDNNWVDMTATDVYLIYKKTTNTIPVTVKYIDQDGKAMVDEAGNSLDRIIDASDWTANQWQNLQGYSEVVDGYTINDMALIQTANGDGDFSRASTSGDLEGDNRIQNVKINNSRAFRYLRYTGSGFQAGNGYQIDGSGGGTAYDKLVKTAPDSKINRYWNISGTFTVYLVYVKNSAGKTHTYTIHYVDTDGDPIYYRRNSNVSGQQASLSVEDPVTIDASHNMVSIKDINTRTFSGYEKQSTGYLGRPSSASGGVPFTSITFTQSADKFNWDYTLTNGETINESKQLNLSNIDIYVVYKKTTDTTDNGKKVVVHFVDTDGNALKNKDNNQNIGTWETRVQLNQNEYGSWKGAKLTDTDDYSGSNEFLSQISSDYSFVGEYIGPDFNMDQNKLVTSESPRNYKNETRKPPYVQWLYQNTKWYVSHGDSSNTSHVTDGTDATVSEGYVTDIYWVYTKKVKVHYVYVGQDNTLTEIKHDGLTNPAEITNISTDRSNPTLLSSGTYVPTIEGKTHIETRLGPAWREGLTGADLGTEVVSVYRENNLLTYSFTNEGSAYTMEKQGNNDMWLYAAPTGRRFILRKTSAGEDNYTIEDSQHGTLSLNLNGDNTYVATFHGDTETTEYTIQKTTDRDPQQGSTGTTPTKDTYTLTVHNHLPSNQTDIYEMYIDDDTSNAKVWINDDLKYSGYFMIGRNKWIEDRMPGSTATGINENEKITSYYYSWEKIVSANADGSDPTTSTVERQQNGIHWNIAYNRTQRTWLDIEADNGGRNNSNQKTVQYRVTMHYKQGEAGDWQTVSSEPLSVDYYSLLMNGSFETPDKTKNNGSYQGDYSNEQYKSLGGVWQTTGLGSTGGKNGMDIEIVNISNPSQVASDYRFANANAVSTADGGSQFAELNAETAGALYQDVVTHPNQYLNYWLSHRARGINRDNYDRATVSATTPEYDTMYLIIMPTKLAMTSAPDGGELKTQSDLTSFIQSHGGYDTSLATAVGQEVTYRDETNGILIEKISSNDQFWHKVNVPNGYIAKGGLTRFFFAAGPTTADYRYAISQGRPTREPTQGNFIDAVGFSQELPTPEGFNLVVKKTFSGLTTDQIANLVDSSKGDEKFKITIVDHARNTSEDAHGTDLNDSNNAPNSALNGAVLSFTKNANGSAVPFTATAVDSNGVNLLTGSNKGDVQQNDDGSITMTWTFWNQAIDNSATDQVFNYYAAESGESVEGKSLGAAKTISPLESGNDNAAVVKQGAEADFTFNNHYEDTRANDQPRIAVSKTFQGLTPSAVDELFADGYQMTVSNGTKTYILTTDDSTLDSNVSYTKHIDENTHNTTVRWTITGEGAGTYTVTEKGYNSSDYKITQIKVNDKEVIDSNTNMPPTASMTESGITVGGSRATPLTIDSTKISRGGKESGATENYNGPGEEMPLPEGTNLIIAQFNIPSAQHSSNKYFVWTPEPVSADVAQAIKNMITESDKNGLGWDTAENLKQENSIFFRSGENPGTLSTSYGSFTYNSDTRALSFYSSNPSAATWVKYYSAVVTKGLDTADIRVVNRYNPVVRIQKVDAGDVTKTLSGAEFRLFKIAGSGTPAPRQYYDADATGNTNPWTTSEDQADSFQTTGDEGSVKLPELPAGTYFLEETKAPDGYNRRTKPIAFRITDDDSVTAAAVDADKTTIDGINADNSNPDWNHPYYTITVENTAGTVLPNTGGSGTWSFMLSGLAMIFLAGGWLWLRNDRKQASLSDGI